MRTRQSRDLTEGTPVEVARRRFGGFDLFAAFGGMLAALGLTVVLAGIAAAADTISYRNAADSWDLYDSGLITGMAVLLVAFLVGGWVAGRMARYGGLRNGLTCGVLFLLLMGALRAVGYWVDDKWDFFADVRLPQWFFEANTTEAVVSALVGIGVVLVASGLGGAVGGHYHRKAEAMIVRGNGMAYLERSADYEGRHAVR